MSTPFTSPAPDSPQGNSNPVSLRGWFTKITDWIKALSPAWATQFDTGWVSVPLEAGYTGLFQVRRIGRVVYMRGNITGTFAVNALQQFVPNGGVPVGFRPPVEISARLPSGTGGQVDGRGVINTGGGVLVINGPIAAVNFNVHPFSGYTVD